MKGLNPQTVGHKIGVSSSTVSQWKKTNTDNMESMTPLGMIDVMCSFSKYNGTMPSVESLIKLADYFNCSTDYLIGTSKHSESLNRVLDCLSAENQKIVEDYANLLLLKQRKDEEKE